MYGKWVECDGWRIFVFCCPSTADNLLLSIARKYANLLNNGYKPDINYEKMEK